MGLNSAHRIPTNQQQQKPNNLIFKNRPKDLNSIAPKKMHNGQEAYEKMLNITNHSGNANQKSQ